MTLAKMGLLPVKMTKGEIMVNEGALKYMSAINEDEEKTRVLYDCYQDAEKRIKELELMNTTNPKIQKAKKTTWRMIKMFWDTYLKEKCRIEDRQILEMVVEGYSAQVICEKLNVNSSKIINAIERFNKMSLDVISRVELDRENKSLKNSVDVLMNQIQQLKENALSMQNLSQVIRNCWTKATEEQIDLLNANIDDLNISQRLMNCLKANNIKTIKDVTMKSYDRLMYLKAMGKKSATEICEFLRRNGLKLNSIYYTDTNGEVFIH